MKLTAYLYIVPRLGINGATPLLHHLPLRSAEEQHYYFETKHKLSQILWFNGENGCLMLPCENSWQFECSYKLLGTFSLSVTAILVVVN
jgi:hypothetical protein